MRARAIHPFVLVVWLMGCGGDDDAPGGDSGVADGSLSDGGAPDPTPDGSVPSDGAVDDDAFSDAGAMDDASTTDDGGSIPAECGCDVTALCDPDCACDIACSVVPGPPPLGSEALLLDRGEIVAHYPSAGIGALDRVAGYDDGYAGEGGPSPAFRALAPAANRSAMAARPVSFGADVDGDGRDEVVLVTPTSVVLEDLSGATLSARTVHTYPSATFFDGAAGDLDGDGAPELVISRQSGTTLTLEVLTLGTTGAATVVASTARSNVARHAVTVARPNSGEAPEIFLLEASVQTPGRVEPIRWHRFTRAGAALVLGASSGDVGVCLVEFGATLDDQLSIAVGNTDTDSAHEVVTGIFCDGGDLEITLHDGGLRERWVSGSGGFPSDIADATSLRPLLAIGRVAPSTLEPGRVVVAIAPADLEGVPQGSVSVLERRAGLLRPVDTRTLVSSFGDEGAVPTDLAVRDLDRDGIDEILVGFVEGQLRSSLGDCGTFDFDCRFYGSDAVVQVLRRDATLRTEVLRQSGSFTEGIGTGVSVAAGDLDADSVRVRATGEVYLHTASPIVNAVLSAPPTWIGRSGVRHTDASGTALGVSTTAGASDTRTINASASVTVSAEAEFAVASFSAAVTASFEYSSSLTMSREVSLGIERSVGDDADLVVLRVVPYASHEYLVVAHPDPAQIGSLVTVDVPGNMIETVRSLAEFRAEHGALADAIIPPGLLPHVIGDPTTYPAFGSCTESAIQARIPGAAGTVGAVPGASALPTPVDVGTAPSGGTTLSIDVTEQTGTSTDVSLSVEVAVGVSAGGVGLETSAGVGFGWTHETFIGRGVSYVGTVGYLAEGYAATTRYEWNLCVFHYTDRQRGSYPVVSYLVRPY